MRSILSEAGLLALLLLRPSFVQASCDQKVQQVEGSGGVGVAVVAGCVETSTNSAGQTVISNPAGAVTLPSGLTTLTTITQPNGQQATYNPVQASSAAASSNTAGQTVISVSGGAVTLPSGLSTVTTISLPNGQVTTYKPTAAESALTTTNTAGQTIISGVAGAVTIPSGVTTPTAITMTNGKVTTYSPLLSGVFTTTTNSAGNTVIINSVNSITLSPGLSTRTVLTGQNGQQVTYLPGGLAASLPSSSTSSTTSAIGGVLFPVTTQVGPTPSGGVIPCKLWFFNLCIEWKRIEFPNISGWQLQLPPGVYPPGPPPPFPSLPGFSITITGQPPPWPKYTIGPDRQPTFDNKPPDNECKETTADFCATTTSFGVSVTGSATTTTSSSVLSTCGKLTGCGVTGTSTTKTVASTTTSACSSGATGTACSTPSTYPYIVYPAHGIDKAKVDAITEELKRHVNSEKQLESSTSTNVGLNYWRLPINESVADVVRNIPNVATVNTQCNPLCEDDTKCIECYDPTISIEYQDPAEPHLQHVSWPPQTEGSFKNRYYFDSNNGYNVKVYILDTGANLKSPEFQNNNLVSASKIRWLHVPGDISQSSSGSASDSHSDPDPNSFATQDSANTDTTKPPPEDDSHAPGDPTRDPRDKKVQADPNAGWPKTHGTTMLSLLAGNTLGVAKRVSPILVRLPRRRSTGFGFTPEDFINGVSMICDDLIAQGGPRDGVRAIVLMADNYPKSKFFRRDRKGYFVLGADKKNIEEHHGWVARFKGLLQFLDSQNVLVVTGAGNAKHAEESPGQDGIPWVTGWPAAFALSDEPDPIKSLLVAGALTSDGKTMTGGDSPDKGVPQIFAPGIDVKVAEGQPLLLAAGKPYKAGSGTSCAAAMTAGIAANFLNLVRAGRLPNNEGFQNTGEGLKNYIIKQAWERAPYRNRHPRSIWNGITLDPEKEACPWDPNSSIRRRTPDATCPVASPPITELKEQAVKCHDGAKFKEHPDISPLGVGNIASIFCNNIQKQLPTLQPGTDKASKFMATNIPGFSMTGSDNKGVKYFYSLQWAENCTTQEKKVDIANPVPGGSSCSDLMKKAQTECKNGGIGGMIQVGCAQYNFAGVAEAKPPCKDCIEISFVP